MTKQDILLIAEAIYSLSPAIRAEVAEVFGFKLFKISESDVRFEEIKFYKDCKLTDREITSILNERN